MAYALLFPAFAIIFVFGIFPLAFSVYESTLGGLNQIVGRYVGLDNYARAIGQLAYVLGFWLAILFALLAGRQLRRQRNVAAKNGERHWTLALPATLLAAACALLLRAFFIALPEVLDIADRLRAAQQAGQEATGLLFRRFLTQALLQPPVMNAAFLALAFLSAGLLLTIFIIRILPRSRHHGSDFAAFFRVALLLLAAASVAWFTWVEVQAAYASAASGDQPLALWSQIVTISAGLTLLGLSWWLWGSASRRHSNLSTFSRLAAASLLIVGGWVLIAEVPLAAASGDPRWWRGLLNTIYYSAGSIPFQFAISLTLATFLFQKIRGRTLFRVIYFLPFITPTVGAAAIFRILFSGRVDAPINRLLTLLGFDALGWLSEPTGIVQLLLGDGPILPAWAAGPSLSLVVIIIFGVWAIVGFNTVIFLAGLGAIPSSLYEAASIDGAGRWAQFRHITLPLLSPTIYFLTLYAVIGTFKAFNHIYVLRTSAALGTADTVSVVIFDAMKRDTRYGYAAALAVVLLLIVLLLTAINNRIARRRVFYG